MASTAATIADRPFEDAAAAHAASSSRASLIYGILIFWAFICLFPIYWTLTTSFKAAPDVMQGHLDPLRRLQAGLEGLALARPLAGHHLRDLDRPRRVPQALHQQPHRLARRLAPRRRDRRARRLRPGALPLPLRADAQQRHLVLLPVAAHPAAGRPRDAVPRPLQGARASRLAARASSSSTR